VFIVQHPSALTGTSPHLRGGRNKFMQKYHFIHEGSTYPPLAIEDIMSCWCGDIEKIVGLNESPTFLIFQNEIGRMYSIEKNYQKTVDFVFNKINKDKKYILKIKKIFEARQKKFFDFISRLNSAKWEKISNREIIKIKKQYVKLYHWFAPYGEPLPYFLKERLGETLADYLLNNIKVLPEEYEILTMPAYQSFLGREEAYLYKIVKGYTFGSADFLKQVKKHARKYQWLLFDYASLIVDEKYFFEKAREFLKKPPVVIGYKKLKRDRQSLIKKYKINELYRYYINLFDVLVYLMDKKKEIFTQLHFAALPLFVEAGKRLGLQLDDVRWFLWDEVESALSGSRKLDMKIAEKRRVFSAIKFENNKAVWMPEKMLEILLKEIAEDQKTELKINEIKGTGVSRGIAKGIVCYLKSPKENGKIKKGEILVAGSTSPDYMPAIRRAAAIVTNSGGITCHAAIVSRELGIPCVVGTKTGTQVLRDGDLVEVDATRGIVMVLERKFPPLQKGD